MPLHLLLIKPSVEIKAVSDHVWPNHAHHSHFIQAKWEQRLSVCFHLSTVWPGSYITCLVRSLTPIRRQDAPSRSPIWGLYVGHFGFHKTNNMNCRTTLGGSSPSGVWHHLVVIFLCTWFEEPVLPSTVLSREVWVSCDLQQQTPAGLIHEKLARWHRALSIRWHTHTHTPMISSDLPAGHGCTLASVSLQFWGEMHSCVNKYSMKPNSHRFKYVKWETHD